MIAVSFTRENHSLLMGVPKNCCLRDIQRDLCLSFKERFPKMLAKVTVHGVEHDDFEDMPFASVTDETVDAIVAFEESTDPFFYDFADRRMPKADEELAWEVEVESGRTLLDFQEWKLSRVVAKPALDDAIILPPWPFA